MHELSLMESVVSIVEETARQHHFTSIKTIRIVLGEITAASPQAMEAAFEAWEDEPLFSNTKLEFERLPIAATCTACNHQFHPDMYCFQCPICGSTNVEMGQGQEFYIDYIEGA